MNAPALCRLTGLMGHMTDLACPKCKLHTRTGAGIKAGTKHAASTARSDKQQSFATPHLTLDQLSQMMRTDTSWRQGNRAQIRSHESTTNADCNLIIDSTFCRYRGIPCDIVRQQAQEGPFIEGTSKKNGSQVILAISAL